MTVSWRGAWPPGSGTQGRDQRLSQEWAADAVDRGYQAIMQAFDPLARRCITALVAEYIHTARAPDRIYRRAANLFTDVIADDLYCLRELLTAALTIMANAKEGKPTIVETVPLPLPRTV